MVGVGSRYERESNSGISHFVEHMVFKGGARYPTARDVSEAIEGVGGVLNAATDREATVFWTRVPSDKLGVAVSVLTDMLMGPVLDAGEVVKERQVVLEELRMYQDNPQDYVQIAFDEVMWPDHPLGWDVAGREETVQTFTSEDCRAHLRRHLLPSTLVVSVSGGFDPARTSAMIDEAIGAVGRGAAPLAGGGAAGDTTLGPAAAGHPAQRRTGQHPDRRAGPVLQRSRPARRRHPQRGPRGGDVEPALPRAPRASRPGLRRPLVHQQARRQRGHRDGPRVRTPEGGRRARSGGRGAAQARRGARSATPR